MSQREQRAYVCPTCRYPFYFKYLRDAAAAALAAHIEREHPDVDRVKEQQR